MTAPPEFSRPVDVRQAGGRVLRLEATESERMALAARFGLVRVDRLEAEIALESKGDAVEATGRLAAQWVQSCALSAEDLAVTIDEDLSFRFVPTNDLHKPDEELEIDVGDCDEIEYSGTSMDVGEAVAQSFGLAIDPYATGPDAETVRTHLGAPEENGPFAVLKELKRD